MGKYLAELISSGKEIIRSAKGLDENALPLRGGHGNQ
jgi:hypothetical protein